MDVEEAVLRRRAVRSYEDRDVSKEKLERVLNAARMAPSARNEQDWKFVVVRDGDVKEKVYRAAGRQSFIREAPVVIAGVSTNPDYVMSCEVPAGIVDLSIALDHITLKATEEGLGTCWVGAFDQEKAKEALDVPEENKIVALMPLGYPKGGLKKKDKDRKSLEEVVSFNQFTE